MVILNEDMQNKILAQNIFKVNTYWNVEFLKNPLIDKNYPL